MKHITTSSSYFPIDSTVKLNGIVNSIVTNVSENYSISVSCLDEKDKDRELAEITIIMPDGSKWTGTIQCFMAIRAFAGNALEEVADWERAQINEFNESSEKTYETIEELRSLLSHFSKGEVISVPAQIKNLSAELAHIRKQLHDLDEVASVTAEGSLHLQHAMDGISDAVYNLKEGLKLLL